MPIAVQSVNRNKRVLFQLAQPAILQVKSPLHLLGNL